MGSKNIYSKIVNSKSEQKWIGRTRYFKNVFNRLKTIRCKEVNILYVTFDQINYIIQSERATPEAFKEMKEIKVEMVEEFFDSGEGDSQDRI